MPNFMIKVAREGLISKAVKTADVGPTSSDSIVYEIQNVPADRTLDDVIAAFRTYATKDGVYEIDWSELAK